MGIGIEAIDDVNFTQSFSQVLKVGLDVVAGFLVSFHDHHDALVNRNLRGRGMPCYCTAFTASIEVYAL